MFQNVYGSGGDQETFAALEMDVFEKDDKLVVKAALPGVKPEDVDITIQNNVLTIRGETREENGGDDEGRGQWHRRERRYGSFFRRIELPTSVDSEGAQAHCENAAIARDLGISHNSLRLWLKQTRIDEGQEPGLTTAEREELRQLRRENRLLREEREILEKAAAFFAKENDRR